MALGVEADDLQLELVAFLHHVTGVSHTLVGELADVDQSLEPLLHAHEGPEVDELRDGAGNDIADRVLRHRLLPWIGLQPPNREADATSLVVDVDDLGLDLIADRVGGLRVVDLVPGELALVDEAIDPAKVDEDAERGDAANGALHLLPDLETAEQLVALLAALLIESDLLREDQPIGLAVDLEDLEAKGAPDKRLQLLGNLLGGVAWLLVARAAREVHDLADRHKAAYSKVDDEAALVVVDHPRVDDLSGIEALLHGTPFALQAGAAKRQDGVSFRRFGLQNVDEDLVADLQVGASLVAIARAAAAHQLTVGNDSLALAAEVDQNLVGVDAHHRALDHVSVLKALDLV